MKKQIILSTLLLSTLAAHADEGMWMLTDLKRQNEVVMMEMGMQIPIEEVYHADDISLKDAVVHFGRGCTGEVISAEGLVLTNHHCGYGSIQPRRSLEHHHLTHGLWAMNRSAELPLKGLTITFIESIYDVSDFVKEQLSIDPDPQGTNYLSPKYLREVADRFIAAEGIAPTIGQSVELKAFYGGNRHYLFVKTTYNDIRLVGAPPSSIGKFGADTDNWMWPRHTGDFSMFRIYADAEGRPAAYSPQNKPLQVKRHVTISLGGVREGDFAFVMGFPGRNWRYMISDEVEERMQTTNFLRHHVRDARQRVLMEQMLQSDAVRIHYASKYASSANYWKNAIGMNEGLERLKVLDTKRAQQEELLAFGREQGTDAYQQAFQQIRDIVAKRRQPMFHSIAIQEALITALDCMNLPNVAPLAKALQQKDKEATAQAVEELKKAADRYFTAVPYPEVERLVAKEMLRTYAQYIPADQRISIFAVIDRQFKGDSDAFVDACFRYSLFANRDNFDRFIRKPNLKQLMGDWMVAFKGSIQEGVMKSALAMAEAAKGYEDAHKTWVAGMMELRQSKGQALYPDANSTLRLTYGHVRPYSPADGVEYQYYTTLQGVMQKEDPSNWEFVVPAKLKQLYEAKDFGRYARPDGQMPVNFIVDTDNTGGNSGSPVFNAYGQLIGTGFDRNYEGLTGDIAFRPASQRAAVVDIRYTLFIIEKFAGAKHLVDEMTIVD